MKLLVRLAVFTLCGLLLLAVTRRAVADGHLGTALFIDAVCISVTVWDVYAYEEYGHGATITSQFRELFPAARYAFIFLCGCLVGHFFL